MEGDARGFQIIEAVEVAGLVEVVEAATVREAIALVDDLNLRVAALERGAHIDEAGHGLGEERLGLAAQALERGEIVAADLDRQTAAVAAAGAAAGMTTAQVVGLGLSATTAAMRSMGPSHIHPTFPPASVTQRGRRVEVEERRGRRISAEIEAEDEDEEAGA